MGFYGGFAMSNETKPACCGASRPIEFTSFGSLAGKKEANEPAPNIEKAASSSKEGMIYLEGGVFLMGNGTKQGFSADGEGPVHEVEVSPFYVDAATVTNAQFAEFVKETRYKTEAEKFGWSFVFRLFLSPWEAAKVRQVVQGTPWWAPVEGAYWLHPEGPDTNIDDRLDHPALHVSWNDAMAYCKWAGKRLPTEAEWEYAARGGLEQKIYPWGDELTPGGEHRCNIWQGTFPEHNTKRDGYVGTAPAKSFPPNGYGLYNVSGNVWEWTNDWFAKHYYMESPRKDPKGPVSGENRVMRGGSFLCHKSYCNRYRVAARSSNTPDSSTGNMGFRCVADA
jgi:formylglycine-generating enzyme required for sulfatase activity